MSKKEARQQAIKDIVRSEHVRTQRHLVQRLIEQKFVCTQATVSRDISELGLIKSMDGYYVFKTDDVLSRLVYEKVVDIDRVSSFCVIRTSFGDAINVADAIDRAHLPNVIGTIAGTDTVLAICTSEEGSLRTADLLASFSANLAAH